MFSSWHREVVGAYAPDSRYIGLDYRTLFLDPLHAEAAFFHELSHSVLTQETEFGQATGAIYRLLPFARRLSPDEQRRIKNALKTAQLFVQEGTASLMETLRLARRIGKRPALDWAEKHMPPDYFRRLDQLRFVFDMSQRYRDLFTSVVPRLAMNTDVRRDAAAHRLLQSPERLGEYLRDPQNAPDQRFLRLLEQIESRPFLVTKSPNELCNLCGIRLGSDVSRAEVVAFMNYLLEVAGRPPAYTPSNVGEAGAPREQILRAGSRIVLANLNLDLHVTCEVLARVDDLLHYTKHIRAVAVNLLAGELHELAGKVVPGLGEDRASLLAFVGERENYMLVTDTSTVTALLNEGLRDNTLIVKRGAYEPTTHGLAGIPGSRDPDAVVYNTVQDMEESLRPWLESGGRASYLHARASKAHPFHTLVLADGNGVLHRVNDFGGRRLVDFLVRYTGRVVRKPAEEVVTDPQHFNSVMSVWMRLPWEIDWYRTMMVRTELVRSEGS